MFSGGVSLLNRFRGTWQQAGAIRTWPIEEGTRWPLGPWLGVGLLAAAIGALGVIEARTSWLQSHVLAVIDQHLSFQLVATPGMPLQGAAHGPYDERLGYAGVDHSIDALSTDGFQTIAHSRPS